MRKTLKIVLWVAVAILVLVAGLFFSRNSVVKRMVVDEVRKATGFDLAIGSLDVGLLKNSFEIRGLELKNPSDFPDDEAFVVDRLFVKYELFSLLGTNIHLQRVDLEIPRVVVVKKEDGESNLERMKNNAQAHRAAQQQQAPPEQPRAPVPAPQPQPGQDPGETAGGGSPPASSPAPMPEEPGPEKQLKIDELHVKIGKFEVRDFSRMREGKPKVRTYEIGWERTFQNVGSIETVVAQITADVLIKGGINEAMEKLKDDEKLNQSLEKIGKKFNKFLEKLNAPKTKPEN